ncbi:spore cortex biosynthesis protein YabQ [Natroniella acetigena]|uniref:spore cortex biosynthesis protein YabQ n=1 Tax=Natroniella acetigena TaxID=52004 RepID=UPI00200A9B92|nr:spore cortex biosynthesis protein YabQ [Natroniella acetigena]MCK8827511.1 spore cortex biosynthesis protein YabQ [Natroniella acetigena]
MVSLRLQLFTFINMMLVGVIIGIIFDFYRVLRGSFNPSRIITDVFDLFFSLVATLLVFLGLIYSNRGEVRIYIFVAVIIGEIIYYLTISQFFIKFFRRLIRSIFCLYNKLKKTVVFLYNRLKRVILLIYNKIKVVLTSIKQRLRRLFKK